MISRTITSWNIFVCLQATKIWIDCTYSLINHHRTMSDPTEKGSYLRSYENDHLEYSCYCSRLIILTPAQHAVHVTNIRYDSTGSKVLHADQACNTCHYLYPTRKISLLVVQVVVIFTIFVRIIEISRKWESNTFLMNSCTTLYA